MKSTGDETPVVTGAGRTEESVPVPTAAAEPTSEEMGGRTEKTAEGVIPTASPPAEGEERTGKSFAEQVSGAIIPEAEARSRIPNAAIAEAHKATEDKPNITQYDPLTASGKMGKGLDSFGGKQQSLDAYLKGNAPWVTVGGDPKLAGRTGTFDATNVKTGEMTSVPFVQRDTGNKSLFVNAPFHYDVNRAPGQAGQCVATIRLRRDPIFRVADFGREE